MDKIRNAQAYMASHMEKTITREQLAQVAQLHPEHFSRMFRKLAGMSPSDYLTRIRMEKAKSLLQQSGQPVLNVARKVGYSDPYHFSRRFKKYTGMAPSLYANRRNPRIVALDGFGHCRALGLEPIAADSSRPGSHPESWPEGLVDLRDATEPSPAAEILRELAPDLIITMRSEWREPLSAIAPVLAVQVLDDPIYEQFPDIARALGKEQEAQQWTSRYEAQCESLRKQVHSCIGLARVAILRVRNGLLQMYGTLNMGYPLYRSLRLTPPERIWMQCACNVHFHSSVITIEELPFYEAEHLFVVLQPDSGAEHMWAEIRASQAWLSYPAVRAGNVYCVDVQDWLAYDPVSIANQMTEAARLITRTE
ncbi:helix-turn-helix domain-containing protein [Cohnella boryungensis]|uniref:Helix-turn-helix domain-containing protein n=2 Tax=Cohnella boryungensis TaxID=768479 RepID=A0ABV8SFH7_9BACL